MPKKSLLSPELLDLQGPTLPVHNDGSRLSSKIKDFQGNFVGKREKYLY
jgi:hypothetical protein